MVKRIGVSGTNFSSGEEFDKIWSIYREIFPKKLEAHYVELANLLFQYNEASVKLFSGHRKIEQIGYELHITQDKHKIANEKIDELINYLNSIKGKALDSTDYHNLLTEFDRTARMVSPTIKDNSLYEQRINEYDKNRFVAGNAHNEINELIKKITAKLEEISRLAIDGKDRLDRIKIEDRHLAKIDNITEIPEIMRESVKQLLKSYVDMQIATFKRGISAAHEINNAYKAYEIIDYSKTDDPRVIELDLIFQALWTLEFDFVEKLGHCFTDTSLNNFHINRNNAFVQIMKWYIDCLSGKEIDINKVSEITLNNPLALNTEVLTCLYHANEVNKKQQLDLQTKR